MMRTAIQSTTDFPKGLAHRLNGESPVPTVRRETGRHLSKQPVRLTAKYRGEFYLHIVAGR